MLGNAGPSRVPVALYFDHCRDVDLSRPKNITVETELGAIMRVENDVHVKQQVAHLADPEQAIGFYQDIEQDLAVSELVDPPNIQVTLETNLCRIR